MSQKTIQVKDLTRRFGDFIAVDHLTFDVSEGEVFGFLGANGAGKTTALRMLCGLLDPSSGEALVAGYDIRTQRELIKRHIGYMSQKFSLYTDLTANENIELFGAIYGLSRVDIAQRKEQIAHKLGIEEQMKSRLVGSMPPGLRQKIAFSVALLHNPKIVFMDEPTGGVDPLARRLFWEMILETAAQGTTMMVTTHYMDEAMYCDRVSIMAEGVIKVLGEPSELIKQASVENMDELFVKIARAQ